MAVILDQLQIEKLKTLPNFTLQHLDKVTELYQHLFTTHLLQFVDSSQFDVISFF